MAINHDHAIGHVLNYIDSNKNTCSQLIAEDDQVGALSNLIQNDGLEYRDSRYAGLHYYKSIDSRDALELAVQRNMGTNPPPLDRSLKRPYMAALFAGGSGILDSAYVNRVKSASAPLRSPVIAAPAANPPSRRATRGAALQRASGATSQVQPAPKKSAVRKSKAKHVKHSATKVEEEQSEDAASEPESEATQLPKMAKGKKPISEKDKKYRSGDQASKNKLPPRKTRAAKAESEEDIDAPRKRGKRTRSGYPPDEEVFEQEMPLKKARRIGSTQMVQNDPPQEDPQHIGSDGGKPESDDLSILPSPKRFLDKTDTKVVGGTEEEAKRPEASNAPPAPVNDNSRETATIPAEAAGVSEDNGEDITRNTDQQEDGASGTQQTADVRGNSNGGGGLAGGTENGAGNDNASGEAAPTRVSETAEAAASGTTFPKNNADFDSLLKELRDMVGLAVDGLFKNIDLAASDMSKLVPKPLGELVKLYQHVLGSQHEWLAIATRLADQKALPAGLLMRSLISSFLLNQMLEKDLPWESPMLAAYAQHPLACIGKLLAEQDVDNRGFLLRACERQLASKPLLDSVVWPEAQKLTAELCCTLNEHVTNLFGKQWPRKNWYDPFWQAMNGVCRKTLEIKATCVALRLQGQWSWVLPDTSIGVEGHQGQAVALTTFPGFDGYAITGEGGHTLITVMCRTSYR